MYQRPHDHYVRISVERIHKKYPIFLLHLPLLCEVRRPTLAVCVLVLSALQDKNVPYVFVRSKQGLPTA